MTELFDIAESQQRQLDVLYEKVAELTAQRDKVLALHKRQDHADGTSTCAHCSRYATKRWPCETRRALGVEE